MDYKKVYELSHEKNMELIDTNRRIRIKLNSLIKDIQSLIKEHRNCYERHQINTKRATCLDIVFKNLEGLKEKRK